MKKCSIISCFFCGRVGGNVRSRQFVTILACRSTYITGVDLGILLGGGGLGRNSSRGGGGLGSMGALH